MRRAALIAGLVALPLLSSGCAAIGLAVIGTALGVGAGQGTAYTLDGIAYRTFTASVEDTRHAALTTLRRMDMKVETDTKVAGDETKLERRDIVAVAGDRKIYLELEKLTTRTTRMRVTAKQGWFWRDRATAGEVIAQTVDAIEDKPTLSQKKDR